MVETREPVEGVEVERSGGSLRPIHLLYAVGVWLGMVAVALVNAVLRELSVTPRVGAYRAHVVSTATLLVVLGLLVYLYFERVPEHTPRELGVIGILWAGLTVAFELGFGHYVAGESWDSLLGQYDVTAGRVWVLVPLFLLVAPSLFGRYLKR